MERRYPAFGNLVPRDVASRAAKERCDKGFGVNNTGLAVFLDFSEAINRLGIDTVRQRYGNLFDMYEEITDVNPGEFAREMNGVKYYNPMMIFPAIHYTMGGIWVDYELQTSVKGLFAIGECNFSDHGANRLGASALMQGLADGYFVLPYTIQNYLSDQIKVACPSTDSPEFDKAEKAGLKMEISKMEAHYLAGGNLDRVVTALITARGANIKLDFPEEREAIAKDTVRFWAGVPNAPKKINPDKPAMKIFLCFIQHLLNSLSAKGKGAIVVPTGFITAKQSIEGKILQRIVDQHIVYGCVSMPSNVFATTGTNVSVLFFDNSRKADKVVLIDASKLGEEYKDGNNQRKRLRDFEIQKIVDTFLDRKAEDGFSVVVSHDEIKAKGYTLSAGQYFDVKIEYVPITADEFAEKIAGFKSRLAELNAKGAELDKEIARNLDSLKFNPEVGAD